MNIFGLILIAILTLIPAIGYGSIGATSPAALSQYLGVVSLIWMGITQLIATRIKGIETIFGSMDRSYILHKWLGVGAVVTAWLHSQIDADLGNIVLSRGLAGIAEDMGEVSFNGIWVLGVASIMTFIPYKLWKWSHRLIGFFFALAAFHYLYVAKPFAVFSPLGLYVAAFCLIGIASYLYLLLPRMLGHNTKRYNVTEVIDHGDITEISLQPQGKGIVHKPGQFTFLNFNPLQFRETHPFTISSAPTGDGTLRFLVKGLGSYTKRMNKLEVGTEARVSAPYGHFQLTSDSDSQVWVGGGIGITPFLAWSEALSPNWQPKTHLYYCVQRPEDALMIEQLEAAAQRVPNFSYSVIASKTGKRLSADQIVKELGYNMANTEVYFCGPVGMRNALKHGLGKHGLPGDNFHYEEFEMREGIGIIKTIRRWFRI